MSKKAYLAGGRFWCLDASYGMIRGVTDVVSGYAGGSTPDPSYAAISHGDTGHAETVEITFDPKIINYTQLLEVFWAIHDPTTLNRQGSDVGTQYRSVIFYADEEQKTLAETSIKQAQQLWDDPIVTELKALEHFYPAEAEHQDYYTKHPEQAYCQIVINPKLAKLRDQYQRLLKA